MSQTEIRLGLTPITKRLAYHFVCRGVGEYPMVDHPSYDRAVVSEFYPWQPNPENPDECAGGLKVTFYKSGLKIRFVEFNVRCVGGGGQPAIRKVDFLGPADDDPADQRPGSQNQGA
jgi:hypothetical protein